MLKSLITGVKGLLSVAKANPHITLAGAAVVGVVGVAVSGYISGKKACTMLEAERIAKGEELTKKEKAKIIAKCAWVTALIAVLTGGAIIGSTYIANKHIKKLAIAYTSASAMLEAHQAAEVAKLGGEVAGDLKESVLSAHGLPEATEENTINKRTNDTDELWYDVFSGFYVWTNVDRMEYLKSELYHYMKDGDGQAELDVLFDFLDYDQRRLPRYHNDFAFVIEDTLNGCEYADKINIKYGLAYDIHNKAIRTFDYYDVCKYIGANDYVPF